uniref:Ovule protein n=1 Tax=Heterorhabditis bacteriophora TaxID=37862 RepID=A0A1I7WHE2_HETBA
MAPPKTPRQVKAFCSISNQPLKHRYRSNSENIIGRTRQQTSPARPKPSQATLLLAKPNAIAVFLFSALREFKFMKYLNL